MTRDAAAPRASMPASTKGKIGKSVDAMPPTPTSQLLARVKRRSIADTGASPIVESTPLKTRSTRSATTSSKLTRNSLDSPEMNAVEDERAERESSLDVEEQLGVALREIESRDQAIAKHQSRVEELEKALADSNKDRTSLQEKLNQASASLGRKAAERGGLTKEAASQLEREFNSQEMILKGLQRDNEAKTIELEGMRRRMKQMADHLARQYGQDWEEIVFGNAGNGSLIGMISGSPQVDTFAFASSSSNIGQGSQGAGANTDAAAMQSVIAKLLGPAASGGPTPAFKGPVSVLGSSRLANSMGSASSSSVDGRRSSSPTKKRLGGDKATSSDEPDATFLSAVDDSFAQSQTQSPVKRSVANDEEEQQSTFEEKGRAGDSDRNTSLSSLTGYDPATILASIEAVRLLIQGFERRQALKMTELNDLVERANEGETRAKELASSWL